MIRRVAFYGEHVNAYRFQQMAAVHFVESVMVDHASSVIICQQRPDLRIGWIIKFCCYKLLLNE